MRFSFSCTPHFLFHLSNISSKPFGIWATKKRKQPLPLPSGYHHAQNCMVEVILADMGPSPQNKKSRSYHSPMGTVIQSAIYKLNNVCNAGNSCGTGFLPSSIRTRTIINHTGNISQYFDIVKYSHARYSLLLLIIHLFTDFRALCKKRKFVRLFIY